MSTRKCGCVYADSRNSSSVRNGYEMSGGILRKCAKHKKTKTRVPDGVTHVVNTATGERKPVKAAPNAVDIKKLIADLEALAKYFDGTEAGWCIGATISQIKAGGFDTGGAK